MRRVLLGAVVAIAVLITLGDAVGAASVSVSPATIGYGTRATLTATGLTPNTRYTVIVYNPYYLPVQSVPFQANASGSYTVQSTPMPADLPGTYTFEIWPADSAVASPRLVARTTATLAGTNTARRLTRIYP